MKVVLSSWIVIFVVLATIPAQALENLLLYDNFNVSLIDPDKWFGSESSATSGAEAARKIQTQRLFLSYRAYGSRESNTGGQFGEPRLNFRNSNAIQAMEATVNVRQFAATGCPANPSPSGAEARLGGFFFDGVFAFILVGSDSSSINPSNLLRVRASVDQCTDSGCSNLGGRDMGTVPQGVEVRLRLQWDPDNDRFMFQRDTQPEVAVPYTVPDTIPGGSKWLGIQMFPANCIEGPRPMAFLEALFDDVFVNASAAPPPSGPASVLTILPSSDALTTTQRFDLSLLVEAPGRSVVGGRATLNGTDVTSALGRCVIPGTLLTGGQTFRCPGLTGGLFGPGTHTLDVVLNLSDGSSIRDTVLWEVLGNTEP